MGGVVILAGHPPAVEHTTQRLEDSSPMNDWILDRRPGAGSVRHQSWWVVVPVKGGTRAKSRLRPPQGVNRVDLARALALDTVAAAIGAVGCERVLVVTSDPEVDAGMRALRVATTPDPGSGLNGAASAGLDGVPPPCAVLLGDVPSLRPSELSTALAAAAGHGSAFVPDAEGTGTVLLTATAPNGLQPLFGEGSASAHASAGHRRLDLDLPGLRRDVDDEATLGEALRLGIGPHTAALLAHLIAAP